MSHSISSAIAALRQLSQVSVQSEWRCCDRDLTIAQVAQPENWEGWAIAHPNDKQHIAWEKGQNVRWLRQVITVPTALQSYPLQGLSLRISLTWWAEAAQVFVNGVLVQEGDLFDCRTRLLLSDAVVSGEEITIALRLVSPGHDNGALMQSVCLYESLTGLAEPSFVADELEVLQLFLQAFDPEKLGVLEAAITQIDWSALPDRGLFDRSLAEVRDRLLPFSELIEQRQIKMVGHAHLDMAWLWTVEETWKAAERTFESVLKLQEDFPELIFCHTTPALYEWIEQNRPELFERIWQQIQAGKWEALGGMWVEPELNLISGESIARHILYGQRYFQEKFGQISPIAWLPDTFGFNWQLPQFLKLGGMRYFVTQKLRWNDTTQFPHELFWWQAPDGSRVLSLMSAPIGEGIDPIKMATYACDWETKTGIPISLWLPGVGDHGGGPTRDMLEVARRWARSPFFPRIEFTTALNYLQQLESDFAADLPVWNSELYLEFHRGCYTTHGDQKKINRDAEAMLYKTELWASMETICTGVSYPKPELEKAWKMVLFNQFHDILPGTSIRQVYISTDLDRFKTEYICETLSPGFNEIANIPSLPAPPYPDAKLLMVSNSLNWKRSGVASFYYDLSLAEEGLERCKVYSLEGQEIEFQESRADLIRTSEFCSYTISFLAEDIPPVGYRCYWTCFHDVDPLVDSSSDGRCSANEFILENEFLTVVVDSETGNLSSIFDKVNQREVLSAPGNQFQAFQDSGQYWDAWNIDPSYAQYPLPAATLAHVRCSTHSFEASIYIERTFAQSRFSQTYSLSRNSPILKIDSHAKWQELHVLVKAAFPLNLEAEAVTYEIPCGTIERSTRPQTDQDRAKWEVSALGWATLSDGNYGVSLLSDCKHGYDTQPNQLRLSLLRGSEFPDPKADRDYRSHTFTYAIYPHGGDWKSAHTARYAYELSHPLDCNSCTIEEPTKAGTLPPVGSFLDLGAENLILTAFKQSEDDPNQWVLRCYECHGEEAELTLQSDLGLELVEEIDLLERPIAKIQGGSVKIKPWTITSFKVSVSSKL
ncbi:MAG TPA: alpha-mannosidase [Thermosynechococcaceae cyanobacterium]